MGVTAFLSHTSTHTLTRFISTNGLAFEWTLSSLGSSCRRQVMEGSGESIDFGAVDDTYHFLFKIVLIGDAGVGKTCVVQRFKHGIYIERHGNTIGVDFMLRTVDIDGKKIKLQIWDTAGQERFRTVTQSYYRGAHGVIIAYDITSMESFSHIPTWVDDIKRYAGPDAVMLLIGTKKDTVTSQPRLREVPFNQVKRYAATKHMLDAIETSAKDNTNIESTFMRMARALWRKNEGLSSVGDTEMSFRLNTQMVEEGKSHMCSSCSRL